MPAPHWFFRFMYDRESAASERRRDGPEQRELVERIAGELANVVASAWFGAGESRTDDVAARAEDLLGDGFGHSA